MSDILQAAVDKAVTAVMAQREEILRAFVAKYGFQPDEAMQVSTPNGWYITRRPSPTEAEVLAAAKRAAAANSSMHEGCDLEQFWRLLDERAQAHWLKVARAVLGAERGDGGRG